MAQYYQIVGQGQSLTLEDLQRYCPNLCLDGIILNQDEPQYGGQQQQYIIRHEAAPRPDFQQQPPQQSQPQQQQHPPQQQQQHPQQQQQQQQQLHRQVYYTPDLPVDAQVVLQQAQQIIDASLMQQSTPQRPQHQLVSPAQVLSQPTVIHPAQQPPPQPPPPQQHTQQLASQQLTSQPHGQQHTQQQITQQHQQQASQSQQQLRAPQLIQHLQQQHQQQQIQLQLHQQQLQHQLQQQHLQTQQININQPHQQVVMHTTYINPTQGTPSRQTPPRLLNQALNSPSGPVTLVRAPVRAARPRRAAPRPGAANMMPARLLNPHSGARAPRVLNPQAAQGQPRPARPRAPAPLHPLQQQQIPQQQISQQQIPQQQISQQQIPQQQITQQQITQQQITQQQINQQQMPQHQMTQHAIAQPVHSQINQHKMPNHSVVVQPNNANDMDDLEESITAAIVQKTQPVLEGITPSSNFSIPPSNMRPNQQQMTYSSQHFQQQLYEQPHNMQHPQTLTQLLMESDDDERQLVTLSTGQRITLAEYKRLQQPIRSPAQQQQARETGRQTLVRSKEQQRPVQRVPPMQTQQVAQHENNEPQMGPSEQASEPQSAKMLIFLQNGEQRLITFTLPKESCTLQEVLEQVNVPFSEDTHIQCMQNTSSEIDYFVSVGSTTRIEEMLENHPMLVGDISSRSSPSVMSQPQSSEMSTPEKSQCPDNVPASPESPSQRSPPPPRLVAGMLAVCKSCGYTGFDFSRCERCKRVFTEEPKGVPIASKKVEHKKKEAERVIEKPSAFGDGIKINLLKTAVKTANNKTAVTDKKTPKVRKPRGKQADPEPVILTLSSDEEDSNSSTSYQHEQSVSSKEPTMSEIEDGATDMDMDDGSREELNPSNMQGFVTSLNCRTIRIGSYRYTPKEKVYISAKGIKIVAPSLKNDREVALQIQLKEVVRILVHFGKGLPVIFLYTMSKCGCYIRNALNMVDESGPYYNPMSKVDPFKRITLLPEAISEESKVALKALFGKVMDELNSREANDILVRTCPKESNNVTKMTTRSANAASASGVKSCNPAEIRQILIYPPGKGGIPINTEDFMCLAQDQFLNDVIIDFYLKYLVHDVLTHSQRERTHIFSTFFYKRLTTKPSKVNRSSNPHEWDSNLSAAQKRHARVKTWTKNVNIFEKDFIVVPINENCHWFVAIICFPSLDGCRSIIDNRSVTPQEIKKKERRSSMLIGNTTITPLTKQEQLTLNCDSDTLSERDEAEGDESDLDMQCDSDEEEDKITSEKKIDVPLPNRTEPIKQPCILIFDSLAGASRSRVVATLRDYLTCEYQTRISQHKVFNKDNIKGSCPKIPQQNNFTDCGLYLLQYVEQFFKDPVKDYNLPIKQLVNWFDEIIVTRKREEISKLLKNLMHKYNPDSHLALPDIAFPTLNGKLIETEESHDESSENDKSNLSKEKERGEGSMVYLKQIIPTGDILVKRNFSDSSDTIHLRKTIRLSDAENRSMVQLKQEFVKKGDSENQILIPIKLHTSDLVKDIQNTLIVNKNNKTIEKKHSVHNQTVSNLNCIRTNIGESDSNSFLKSRRVNKLEDMNDSSKKFKRNEC